MVYDVLLKWLESWMLKQQDALQHAKVICVYAFENNL